MSVLSTRFINPIHLVITSYPHSILKDEHINTHFGKIHPSNRKKIFDRLQEMPVP